MPCCNCREDPVALGVKCALGEGGGECPECLRLIDLESQIQRVKAILDSLVDDRRRHYTEINNKHDILRRHLPIEVIAAIFEHTPREKTLKPGERKQTAITLGLVSKAWRSITLSIPRFWNSLTINIGPTHRSNEMWQPGRLSGLMTRSGSLPLHLRIVSQGYPLDLGPIFDILRAHADRWDTLDLFLRETATRYLLSNCSSQNLKVLRLSSSFNTPSFHETVGDLDRAVNCFPSPLSISTRRNKNGPDYLRTENLPISWSNIREFDGSLSNHENGLFVIKSSPLLQNLRLHILTEPFSDPTPSSQEIVTGSSLRTLHLSGESFRGQLDLDPFFDKLITPSLSKLYLEGTHSRLSGSALKRLIHRSSCILTTLVFDRCHSLNDSVKALLSAAPTLETLEIEGNTAAYMNRMIGVLVQSSVTIGHQGVSSSILPCLKVLKLRLISTYDKWLPDKRLFTDFLKQRSSVGATSFEMLVIQLTVEYYHSHTRPIYDAEVIATILRFRERGVVIDMTSNDGSKPTRDFIEFCLERNRISGDGERQE